jgi:biotin operon repressor
MMTRRTRGRREERASSQRSGPYGYVLLLRLLAAAAIELWHRPGALRVLILLAEYSDQSGRCHVSQETIAARLCIRRQTVAEHIQWLAHGCGYDFLRIDAQPGRASRYRFVTEYYREPRDEDGDDDVGAGRANIDFVAARRAENRARRRAQRNRFETDPRVDKADAQTKEFEF